MTEQTDRKLQQRVLLGRRVEGDQLVLTDAVLEAALAGTRHLTAAEKTALQASPLTLRRLRVLSLQRAAAWRGSQGMLRAASSGGLTMLGTDDGHWALHFVEQDDSWRVVLVIDPGAPFTADMPLKVSDGEGNLIMAGRLDADGECEAPWPFAMAPAAHFQAHGAAFFVQPDR